MVDDKIKPIHGVFTKDCLEIMDTLIKNKGDKHIGYMCDIYCVNVPECGYEGGKNGDGHILDYVTFITLPNSNKLITMFPSDNIIKEKDKDKLETRKENIKEDDGER